MKKWIFAAPIALAATLVMANPAMAQTRYNAGHNANHVVERNNGSQLRAEIQQLDRRIDRMRGISQREEVRLNRQVNNLQSAYRTYARGGFTNAEVRQLDRQITRVKVQINSQANDRNARRR